MAAAIIPQAVSVVASLGGLFGGSNKNALRDQQEADRFARAKSGSVTDAQGIYHDSLPQNKQTGERIKDDQGYWSQLQGLGWTLDASGNVHPPAAARAATAPQPGWTSGAPASMVNAAASGSPITTYSSGGSVALSPAAAPTQSHAVAYAILAVTALVAILFMFRSHFA